MRYGVTLSLLLAVPCWGQTTTTGKAETTGLCSPAVTGSKNTFTIDCGISKAQGQKMLNILNKILTNQLDPNAVMAKLDEIERQVRGLDPKAPVITYFYNGEQRISRPGQITSNADNPAAKAFLRIEAASSAQDWPTLVSLCDDAIKETPEWLTPYLYKGLAYANIGRVGEAVSLWEDAKKKADGNLDYELLVKRADELLQKAHARGY